MDKCNNAVQRWRACIGRTDTFRLILYTVFFTLAFTKFSQANDARSGVGVLDSTWQEVGAAPEGTGEEGWFRTSSEHNISSRDTKVDSGNQLVEESVTRPGSVVPMIVNSGVQSIVDTDATQTHSLRADAARADIAQADTGPVDAAPLDTAQASSAERKQWGLDTATLKIDLFVGEVRVLGEFDATRVAVGNGAVVKAEILDSGELLIIATSTGSTSVRLWNRDKSQTDYNIRVSENDPETRLQMQRMVRMRVRMVEFRKSALGSLGIDWSDGTSGPAFGIEGDASFDERLNTVTPFAAHFGIASNITSRINFLAQNGDAVTLAEPVLSTINGGEASFLAGGEVPYPSIGENGQTQVEFKEYGVKLNIAPLIDNAGNVHARLETEISQLDSSVSVQGTPGLLTRRAQTEVTVRSGETIVISGLLSTQSSADADMIPGLGRLPVIGRLFSARNKRNTVNELVIFVTPEVIEPHAAMINPREQQYLRESDKRMNVVRGQLPLME